MCQGLNPHMDFLCLSTVEIFDILNWDCLYNLQLL
jgi:hypothetical protein